MNGQELVKVVQQKLAGFANASNPSTILMYLNEAKDEIWAVLKSLNEQYFMTQTQATDATADAYFAPLTPTTREYDLPDDFKEIKFIEVVAPTNQTVSSFKYRKITHSDFIEARRAANNEPTASQMSSEYIYTIAGNAPQQFVLATYPAVNMTLKLWYIRDVPDFGLGDVPSDIIAPYDRKMTDYAAKRVMLANDLNAFAMWKTEWRDSLIMVGESAGPRNQADAEFVEDFEG